MTTIKPEITPMLNKPRRNFIIEPVAIIPSSNQRQSGIVYHHADEITLATNKAKVKLFSKRVMSSYA